MSRVKLSDKRIIELRMWIFRILDDQFDFKVRVEGYRSKNFEDDDFRTWKSSPITERYNSRILLSSTGTQYVLCGVIDAESALSLGYPLTIVDRFKEGFPPDWEQILQKQYRSTKENQVLCVPWLNSAILYGAKEHFFNESSASRHSLPTQEEDTAANRVEYEASGGSVSSDEENRITLEKNEQKQENSFPINLHSELPICQLCNWTFRFAVRDCGASKLFENFGIVLEGFRIDQDRDWKTSCVTAVKSSNRLCTASTEYELMGPMNTPLALQQGFPAKFIRFFKNGFPDNWHSLISDFFARFIEPELCDADTLAESVQATVEDLQVESKPVLLQSTNTVGPKPVRGNRKRRRWNVK